MIRYFFFSFQMIKLTIRILLIIYANSLRPSEAIFAFDCGETAINNVTTISLVDIGDCDITQPKTINETGQMMLLQLDDYEVTHVFKCTVKITRMVTRCGMWSHASRVADGEATFYQEVTREDCFKMYNTGYYAFGNAQLHNLKKNHTNTLNVVFAGSAGKEGDCEGGSYVDPYGSWNKVYAAGTIEITITDYYTEVLLETNKIILKSGISCALQNGQCVDYDAGYAFWDAVPVETCGLQQYSVLYEGPVDKLAEESDRSKRVMYSIESNDITFALLKKGEKRICGYTLIITEHPKLFIFENPHSTDLRFNKATIPAANLDLFAYMNSKFVYVEKFIRKQLVNMYFDILKHKCELERKVFANALSIASISPSEFGYRLMEEEGYLGVVTGEVVHLIKCIRVEVKERKTEGCYEQLPVTWKESDYFVAPKTRILLKTGTPIHCDYRLPAMFKLAPHLWFKLLPNAAVKADAPEILKPQTKPTWTYNSPETLAIGGIYSERDTRRLRDMILFPLEKPAVLNKVALGMSGRTINVDGLTVSSFLDRATLEALVDSTYAKFWGKFMDFGTASAGVIGMFVIFRLLKLIIDTIIHGYAIYSLYGFSIHLLGAIWNSVTQLLLHLAHSSQARPKQTSRETIEDDTEEDGQTGTSNEPTSKPREKETLLIPLAAERSSI